MTGECKPFSRVHGACNSCAMPEKSDTICKTCCHHYGCKFEQKHVEIRQRTSIVPHDAPNYRRKA